VLSAAKEIKPPVHPTVSWAFVEGRIACVVKVDKGLEAIYYSTHRPIVRRGPTSRPAEPGEVEQVFRARYSGRASSANMPSTKLIGRRMNQVLGLMNAERDEPLTVVDLARAMDLSTPAELEAVVEGHTPPTFAILDQFSARFAINKEWLATGRGPPLHITQPCSLLRDLRRHRARASKLRSTTTSRPADAKADRSPDQASNRPP
jgi:hypothetical protein